MRHIQKDFTTLGKVIRCVGRTDVNQQERKEGRIPPFL